MERYTTLVGKIAAFSAQAAPERFRQNDPTEAGDDHMETH